MRHRETVAWRGAERRELQHLTDCTRPRTSCTASCSALAVFSPARPACASTGLRLGISVALEAGWEIVENTDAVIQRYRETTIALDYYGDSVVNSVADMLAMVLGFVLAWRLPVPATVALALVLELGVGYWICDNLTLNVIMLLHPLDTIRAWQAGA